MEVLSVKMHITIIQTWKKYIESYQLLKEKNITSINQLKKSITDLRDKNYKITRALKDTEKK